MKNRLCFALTFVTLIFICICLQACSGIATVDKDFSWEDFGEIRQLNAEFMDVDFWGVPTDGYVISDSLLVTLNLNGGLLSFYDINSGTLISENLRRGRGPGELLSARNMQICGDSIWVFDIYQTGLFCFNIKDLLNNKDYQIQHEIRLNAHTGNMICIDRNKNVLASTSDAPFSRFCIYDSAAVLTGSYGSLPFYEEAHAELAMHNADATFALASDGKIIVVYKGADILEVYSPDFKLLHRVRGPDGFLPDNEVQDIGASSFRIKAGENYRDAYFRPFVIQDEVWVIYSGRRFDPYSKVPGHFNEYIFVFDHDLNPLRAYKTDIPFYSISVDPSNKCVYSLTEREGEPELVKFSF